MGVETPEQNTHVVRRRRFCIRYKNGPGRAQRWDRALGSKWHCDWNTGGKLKNVHSATPPGFLSFLRAAGHLEELFQRLDLSVPFSSLVLRLLEPRLDVRQP